MNIIIGHSDWLKSLLCDAIIIEPATAWLLRPPSLTSWQVNMVDNLLLKEVFMYSKDVTKVQDI